MITLEATALQISLLDGIECAVNLESLYLAGNQIHDIAPIAGLTALQIVNLSGNQASDIAPIVGLVNLHALSLVNNVITDLSPLTGVIWKSGWPCCDIELIGNPLSPESLDSIPEICTTIPCSLSHELLPFTPDCVDLTCNAMP